MKKLKKILSLLLAVAIVAGVSTTSLSVSGEDTAAPQNLLKTNGISPISGTFIQPWLYMSYTDEDWDREMQYYKELGIEYIVMGDCAYQPEGGKWEMSYPSKLEGVKVQQDTVTILMDKAKAHGMKVYLGMGNPHEWWKLNLSIDTDGEKLMEMARMATSIAQELYDIYKKDYPDTFYGFYSVYEIWNHESWNDEKSRGVYADNLSKAFNLIIDKINSLDPSMPLLFSPFATPGIATLENTQAFYTDFFNKTNFRKIDAMAPMDNIGGGGTKIEELEPWTQAYRAAVDASGGKLQFWQNCESFVQPTGERLNSDNGVNYWGSAPVERFVRQLEIASKYADRIFNFAYAHYYSPVNNVGGYQEAFYNYLKTGQKDTTAPLPPDRIKTTIVTADDDEPGLRIQWDGEWDDLGISRINVYKNGSLLDYRVTTRMDGTSDTPYLPSSVIDDDYISTMRDNLYEIEVIDCWGNASEKSSFVIPRDNYTRDDGLRQEKYADVYGQGIPEKPADWKLVQETRSSSTGNNSEEDSPSIMPYIIGGGAVVIILAAVLCVVIIRKKKSK